MPGRVQPPGDREGRWTGTRRKIADTAARLKRLYTAAVYDIMDEMGLRHQCLDIAIKPIERTMRIAGPAFTIAGASDPRTDDEYDDFPEVRDLTFFRRMYAGCVVVIAAAGETRSGPLGRADVDRGTGARAPPA